MRNGRASLMLVVIVLNASERSNGVLVASGIESLMGKAAHMCVAY